MIYADENFLFNTTYEVLSIFDNVINLKKDENVYAIFNENILEAPYSLILKSDKFNEIKTNILDNKLSKIYIADMKATRFNCFLNTKIYDLDISNLEKKVRNFKRVESIFETEFQKKRKEKNLFNLIGLGLGLTPSGDDYIVGLMAAYYLTHENKYDLFLKIAEFSKDKTNDISHCYIKNASNRLFKKEILDLLYDISNKEKIDKLINFGSSSGQDIIYGIYDYLSGKISP